MPSRSRSSFVFSPRLRVMTNIFGLNIDDIAMQMANESKTDRPRQDQYTYAYTSDGIEIRQPQQKVNNNQVLAFDSSGSCLPSMSGSIALRSGPPMHDLPSQWTRKQVDDECQFPIPVPKLLYQRRGMNIANLNDEVCLRKDSYVDDFDAEYFSGESPLFYPPINDQYIHVKDVGSGGEGDCSLLRRKDDSQLRVMKTVMRSYKIAGKPIEATMLQDLFPDRHDNIIRLHDFEAFDGGLGVRYYFEYCGGGDLYDLVSRYKKRHLFIPELFIFKAFTQLSSALEFLHRGFDRHCEDPTRPGINHRDIKPENIFLRLSDRGKCYPDVVLADFGCATLDFATYDRKGTATWQGPELPRQSPKGDVYSLGAVIHYLIFFETPLGPLPNVPNTRRNRDLWHNAPEARQPRTTIPGPYSRELCEFMLIAMNPDHNTRIDAARLSKDLRKFCEKYLPKFDGPDDESYKWPLGEWAFGDDDEGCQRPGEGEISSSFSNDKGTQQYFQMFDVWEAEKRAGTE